MTTAIVEYTQTEAALAELRMKYADVVFDVATTKGMTEAKAARAELRTLRVNLEAKRKEIKAPALKRCAEIDTEAKRITAELAEMEDPIDAAIKAEESRKEHEKAEKERLDRERTEALNRRFDAIKALPLRAVDATAAQIEAVIAEAQADPLDDIEEKYQAAAKYELGISILSLKAALDKRRMADENAAAEAARIAAEREELERLRAESAARQAEADRLAAAERERLAAEQRRQEEEARAEREAAEERKRVAREEEQRRIEAERAERRRREDEERAQAEAERKERQRREDEARAAEAEELRKAQIAAEAERRRLADERAAQEKAARDRAIAEATLLGAAVEAVALLKASNLGAHIVTLKLEAAIRREPITTSEAA